MCNVRNAQCAPFLVVRCSAAQILLKDGQATHNGSDRRRWQGLRGVGKGVGGGDQGAVQQSL